MGQAPSPASGPQVGVAAAAVVVGDGGLQGPEVIVGRHGTSGADLAISSASAAGRSMPVVLPSATTSAAPHDQGADILRPGAGHGEVHEVWRAVEHIGGDAGGVERQDIGGRAFGQGAAGVGRPRGSRGGRR
jgi:hypothetical protein